jgi:hypothetical protein
MSYKFTLSEYHPVIKVELEKNNRVSFWYEGEDPDVPTMMTIESKGPWEAEGEELRPGLKGSAATILNNLGEEACIRHINKRISNYILDQYEEIRDSCPEELEKQYLEKIDEFYLWFWNSRHESDQKLYGRFLRHIQSIRQKYNPPAIWYTVKEAAIYARCSVTKIRELKDSGKLSSHRLDDAKVKGTILFHQKDLDAVILFDRSSGLTKRQQNFLKAQRS